MIATLIIIGIALAWLGYETDWLRVRLESTEYQRQQLAKAKAEFGNTSFGKVKDSQPEDTESLYQPSQFTPLDIPATTGDLNIICQRG